MAGTKSAAAAQAGFALIFLFFAAFILYPLAYVVKGAFFVGGKFTASFFTLLLTNRLQLEIILNTINLAFTVTALTAAGCLPLSVAMVRYTFPGKRVFQLLLLVPLVLPPFVGALGMKQIFGRFGIINMLLMKCGVLSAPIDWLGSGGFWGVVLLEALHLFPIMYLSLSAALSSVDASLEQAARSVGARGMTVWRRILLPLMSPGIFASASVVFVWSFTDLGAPLVFEYRRVVPVQVFNMLSDIHSNQTGYALIVLMIAISLIFFSLSKRLMPRGSVATQAVTRISSVQLEASRLQLLVIYSGLSALITLALLPHLGIFLVSLSDRWFMSILPSAWTTEHYASIFSHHLTLSSIRNSLILSCASASLDIIAGVTIAYLLSRSAIRGKPVLDMLTMLPLAIPGVVIAFGYLGSFSGTFIDPRVNPVPLLIIGYAIRRLPYMVRAVYAGLSQVSTTLEDAAAAVGAGTLQTLRHITLPLLLPNLIGGAILCFSFAMLEVSDSLILALEEPYFPITKAIYYLLSRPDGTLVACALGIVGMVILSTGLFAASRILGRRMGEIFKV